MTDDLTRRSLEFIGTCSDPKKLRQIEKNARREGNATVARAAQLRLYSVLPAAKPGTLEYDVWQSIYALEGTLTIEKGKTMRLSRTRQKIARDSELKTVSDLVMGKPSAGFQMLIDREMAGLTFEAVALRHPKRFSDEVLRAAEDRLAKAGIDPSKFRSR